jgi:hypothetical protein
MGVTTTLVGQYNNGHPPFILELIIQQPAAIVDNIVTQSMNT